jgi:hypothetical protein
MTKEKTAQLIPNAIQIITEGEKVKNYSTFVILHGVKKICLILIIILEYRQVL